MFDPSKLDVDFSDTSNLNEIEKQKIKAAKKLKLPDIDVPDDIINEIETSQESKNFDTMVLENNDSAESVNQKIQKEKQIDNEVGRTLQINNKHVDTAVLATIITDSELVENNKEVKEFKDRKTEEKQDSDNPDNQVIDINLKWIDDVASILLREKYDYVRLEPNDEIVKVIFAKDSVDKLIKFIKYPVYLKLLIAIKKAGKLKLDITDTEQKWKSTINFLDKKYDTVVRTKPSDFWENAYFKIEETSNVWVKAKKEKISFSKIMWILVALLLTSLIMWGLFLGFILFNSNSLSDLKFFNDLGVKIDEVRQFVSMLVNGIFFAIVFILSVFTTSFLFKAILTKKEFKKKKINASIIAIILIIVTFSTWVLWLSLSKKVNELKSLNYWSPVVYDNEKLLSSFYEAKRDAIVNIKAPLIWPVTLNFDISAFLEKLKDDGNTPTWITWIFDDETIEKPAESFEIIKEFSKRWVNTVNLVIETVNLKGEEEIIEEVVAKIDISWPVVITEQRVSSWWKTVSFNASELSNLGGIEWYYIPNLKNKEEEEKNRLINEAIAKPIHVWNIFSPQKVIFDEEIVVWMYINITGKVKTDLDKIFIINGDTDNDIEGEIIVEPSIKNDLTYNFYLEELENSFGNGFIDTITWDIDGKQIEKNIDIWDIEKSTKIEYSFKTYWDKRILVTLTDTNGNVKVLEDVVAIAKKLALTKTLEIFNNTNDERIGKYNKNTFEYSINDLATPTELRLDARFVAPSNQIFAIRDVEWDFDSDGSIDETWKLVNHLIETEWNHHITVKYTFEHRSIKWETIEMTENIYIDSVKKDVILDLRIEKESNYAPIIVRFDASASQVKWDDIEKFIFDYGDGTKPEERDAINPWHKYLVAWDYTVKLTVKTKKWKSYGISKTLNLQDRAQEIVISTSLKRTKTFQEINFWSERSNGQIDTFLWEFWDGDVSTVANPVKAFTKPWEYTVKLTGTFNNNNVETDEMVITIEE